MNHYEVLAIISGKYAENELEVIQQKLSGYLEKHTSTVHYTQSMGRKKLTYPINHLSYGYYFLIEFDAESKNISKLDRDITLNKDVLRHIIVKRDTVGAPKSFEKEIRRDLETVQGTQPRASQIPAEYRTLFSGDAPQNQTQPTAADTAESSPIASTVAHPANEEPVIPEETSATPPMPVQPAQTTTAVTEDEASTTETQEEVATKKKSKKVSYEELDKKLDELLKDDIL